MTKMRLKQNLDTQDKTSCRTFFLNRLFECYVIEKAKFIRETGVLYSPRVEICICNKEKNRKTLQSFFVVISKSGGMFMRK